MEKPVSAATDAGFSIMFFKGNKMTSAERTARITELQTEIAEINTTLSNMRKAGQSYTIMTSAGGGSQRMTTMVTYKDLLDHKNELNAELKSLQGESAFRMRPAW